jgi:hypothetical protein
MIKFQIEGVGEANERFVTMLKHMDAFGRTGMADAFREWEKEDLNRRTQSQVTEAMKEARTTLRDRVGHERWWEFQNRLAGGIPEGGQFDEGFVDEYAPPKRKRKRMGRPRIVRQQRGAVERQAQRVIRRLQRRIAPRPLRAVRRLARRGRAPVTRILLPQPIRQLRRLRSQARRIAARSPRAIGRVIRPLGAFQRTQRRAQRRAELFEALVKRVGGRARKTLLW